MHGYLKKEARTLRPNQLLHRWHSAQQINREIRQAAIQKTQELSADPIKFFEQVVGFKPFTYQTEFIRMFQENQFTAARWCRQSGKTFIIAALLLWYATTHPQSAIGIVGPSWRQTKRILSRIAFFTHKLPPGIVFKPQRTQIHFVNGSSIEAFPNNPETIRSPTLHVVYCDEMNFIPNDQELYDAILFTLSTTDGKFVCSSTPWTTDSIFWKIFNHKNFDNFGRLHVSWEMAMAPNGPLKPNTIAEIKKMFGDDPIRWRREMEAEWAEDENTWLPQSLVASCVGTVKNACGEDLHEFNPDVSYEGEFFAGLDLAQTRDYCVLSIVERLNNTLLLRHVKIFAQPTLYASVLGYLKMLQDRWGGFQKIRVDVTREGPSFISDMENAGIDNGEGVIFSVPRKSEMASLFKQRMSNHVFFFPEMKWEKLRTDIYSELNVERYDLRKDGTIGYSHPNGSHDDVFWSIALAVYATIEMQPEPFLTIIPR